MMIMKNRLLIIFCIDVGDRFQLSLYEVDSAPIRELFLFNRKIQYFY